MSSTIGIFAHVDAGKTTLSEQILYKAKTIRKVGKVNDKNSFLDYNDIEKERGITVFADEANFKINDCNFSLIDTPGHIDFSGEMERSLLAIDVAILVISSVEGVQSHTETIWKLLKSNNKPVIIFLNKADRDIAQPKKVLDYIKNKFDSNFVLMNSIDSKIDFDEINEEIASCDEKLMDSYIENGCDENFNKIAKDVVSSGKITPVLVGSAINSIGVDELFSLLEKYYSNLHSYDSNDEFSGVVYKIRHDKNKNRVVFLKVIKGELNAKDLINTKINDEITSQKINEIRLYNADKFINVQNVVAGDLCAVTGLSDVMAGDFIGENCQKSGKFSLQPLMQVGVEFSEKINSKTILDMLNQLQDEEPLLNVKFNSQTQQIIIQTMGEIQLEIIKEEVKKRYDIDINFTQSQIIYKETITTDVVGCGHYEPLRHYAEVHLLLSPNKRGEGITFESRCSVDNLSLNWQRLIETHVFEKEHIGVLTGSPITDIKITLLAGKAHIKHTEGGDFRESTYRAIRQALMYSKSILLEPWFKFTIEVQQNLLGRVMSDIEKMGGKYDVPQASGDDIIITGICSVEKMQNYSSELIAYSKGKGRLSLQFDNYYPCNNQKEIIEKIGYNPERDIENTADSIFCSHGAGYGVKWDVSKNYMHLL